MLSDFMFIFGSIIITIFITSLQKYFSTRKQWQFGAIIPIVSIVVFILLFYVKSISITVQSLIPCAVILALELFMWFDGRKECRNNEIRKMKAKDII